MRNILLILIVLIITIARFRRGIREGLTAATFFWILLPTELRVQTPGALPELTVHRILLVVAALFILPRREGDPPSLPVPGIFLIAMVVVSKLLSTLTAQYFLPSLKEFLLFVLEIWFFYYLACRGLRDREALFSVLRAALLASVVVACLATLEKYRGTNLAAQIVPGVPNDWRSVTATYRHRILLGYAMAMAFPLAFAMRPSVKTRWDKILVWAGLTLLPAACYFANSRGPWVGAALGGSIVAFAAGRHARKPLIILGCLVALVLVTRPGVYKTIHVRWEQTQTTQTGKGKSASYRLELWRVAYEQISKSGITLLFGYGGGSAEQMQLGKHFEFGGGSNALGYTSWDSEFALNLLKYGFLGLFAMLLLYGGIVVLIYSAWRRAPPEDKLLQTASLATVLIFVWAMTNVAIFNPQLTYLFWTMVAISARANQLQWTTEDVRVNSAIETEAEELAFPPTALGERS